MGIPTMRRLAARAFLAVSLLVWLPAVPFGIALSVGTLAGCERSEATVRPCVIARLDFGLPLTLMGIMGWFVVALLPLMALTLLIGVLWGGLRLAGAMWAAVRSSRAGRGRSPAASRAAPSCRGPKGK